MAITTSVQSPADAINAALARVGHTFRVANLYDGSRGAKLALDQYGQTRDQMLRDGQWGFAQRDLVLTLLKSAPVQGYFLPNVWNPVVNPPLGWLFSYAYPSDCLKVRAIKGTPLFLPVFDPQPVVFNTPNDATLNPPGKVIVCNVASAICTYTGRITDPTQWEASFTEAFIEAMSRRLSVAFGNLDTEKLEAAAEQADTAMASVTQG